MESAERFVQLVNRRTAMARLDLLAALIGTSFDPAVEPGEVLNGLDRLSEMCGRSFPSVMESLFTSGRLRGNRDDYGDPRNSFLHQVIERGVGIPITLSVCAIEVGKRLGLQIDGIGLPGHFLVESGGMFGDPFNGTIHTADEVEQVWQRATGRSEPLDRRLLVPAHTRSILLRILNNLKQTLVAMDDPQPLRVLAQLRSAFPELANEAHEHARWLRHWN